MLRLKFEEINAIEIKKNKPSRIGWNIIQFTSFLIIAGSKLFRKLRTKRFCHLSLMIIRWQHRLLKVQNYGCCRG